MRFLLPMLASVLLALACRDTPAVPSGQPAEAVERLYAAVAEGDCPSVLAELSASYRARVESAGCAELLEQLGPYPLERIIETKSDGRDRAARLVRTRVRNRKNDVIIRVEAEDGRWKIASL